MASALSAARGLWCIVLAAGGSRRLGRSKQLLRYRGRTLLTNVLALAETLTSDRVVVVLGADAQRLRSLVQREHSAATVVHNADWPDGLAGSLQLGLAAVPRRANAALILLTDQPRIRTKAVERLVRRWARCPGVAAASSYGGHAGVPAILPRHLWRQARSLEGDTGARVLLAQLERLTRVPMPDAAFDIDTQQDLQAL
jgi:molybdenum cofactor cytidylyltransferase